MADNRSGKPPEDAGTGTGPDFTQTHVHLPRPVKPVEALIRDSEGRSDIIDRRPRCMDGGLIDDSHDQTPLGDRTAIHGGNGRLGRSVRPKTPGTPAIRPV